MNGVPSFARFGPCRGCKDRCPYPNCHLTCERFLIWQQDVRAKKDAIWQKKTAERVFSSYKTERIKAVERTPLRRTAQQKRAEQKHRSLYFLDDDGGTENGKG